VPVASTKARRGKGGSRWKSAQLDKTIAVAGKKSASLLLIFTCRDTQNQLTFRDGRALDGRCNFELNQPLARRDLLSPKMDFLPRPNSLQKFQASDGREQEKRSVLFRAAGRRRNSRGLRQGFSQDHTGNDGIAREMSGEHRIALFEPGPRPNRSARLAFENLTDKNERWPMGKAKRVISDQ
jgi:hypothetical protein